VLAAVLALAGVCVLFYPTVLEWRYEQHVATLKDEFIQAIADPTAPDGTKDPSLLDQLYARLQMENTRLFETGQDGLTDAWTYEQPSVDLSAYGLPNDCIGFISLPTIHMELPLYLGANTANMAKGAVHLTQTSYPIGGDNTNCVIAAHRGTSLVMFRDINKIKIGDEITLTNFRETLTYRAAEIKIIVPSDIDQILIQPGRDLVTLISCNPLGHNYQRYVVYCERVQ